jgi:tetratricopeptide (TPR) repeat protein
MGKTSVALAIANDPAIIARFGDRRHFVPCEEVSSPAPLIELIATHLGIQLPSTSPLPHVLSSLRKLHSPCLLILDNFETPWEPHETRTQIEQIVTDISCAPLLTLIITMRGRDPPAGIKWSLPSTPLNPLSLRAAKSTFLDIWSSDDWRLDDLLRSLDLLPLAITLIASVGQSGQLTPSELLLCWKEEQTKLLDLGPTDRLKSIEYTIRLSLQSPAMKSAPDAFRLLSIIAMLPSGAVLKSLPKLAPHIANLNRVVRVLISVSLAYKDDAGTLRLLSPIRSYFSHYHAPDQESLVYLRTHYYRLAEACRCQPGDKHFVRVSNGIRPEESNMESILSYYVSHAGDEDAVRAVVNYSWYLYWRDRRSRVLGVLEAATSAARRQRFSELLPRCLQQLGNILHKQGKYNEAASAYEEAVELFRLNGNEASTADCLTRLGEILRNQCRWDDSRTKLEEARNICQKTGDRLGLSWCLRSLGEIFKVQDRCDEACVMLENAQELFQELGRPLGAAQCLRSLGQVHHSQGKEE